MRLLGSGHPGAEHPHHLGYPEGRVALTYLHYGLQRRQRYTAYVVAAFWKDMSCGSVEFGTAV